MIRRIAGDQTIYSLNSICEVEMPDKMANINNNKAETIDIYTYKVVVVEVSREEHMPLLFTPTQNIDRNVWFGQKDVR
jgi:hypothetical protein